MKVESTVFEQKGDIGELTCPSTYYRNPQKIAGTSQSAIAEFQAQSKKTVVDIV